MRRALIAILFLSASLFAKPASADLITYQLQGQVTSVDSALSIYMPGIVSGTPLQLLLTYDPVDPFSFPNAAVSSVDLIVAGYDICGGWANQHPSPNVLRWSGSLSLCQGALSKSLLMDWLELSFTSINPLTTPGTLWFHGLDPTCTPFTGCTHTDQPAFFGSLDSVTTVPDGGSTLLLTLIGVGALVVMKRGVTR